MRQQVFVLSRNFGCRLPFTVCFTNLYWTGVWPDVHCYSCLWLRSLRIAQIKVGRNSFRILLSAGFKNLNFCIQAKTQSAVCHQRQPDAFWHTNYYATGCTDNRGLQTEQPLPLAKGSPA
ncbi:TPA: hypothetical protein ACH3X2_007344 [Trebouxia sp. C0005]